MSQAVLIEVDTYRLLITVTDTENLLRLVSKGYEQLDLGWYAQYAHEYDKIMQNTHLKFYCSMQNQSRHTPPPQLICRVVWGGRALIVGRVAALRPSDAGSLPYPQPQRP